MAYKEWDLKKINKTDIMIISPEFSYKHRRKVTIMQIQNFKYESYFNLLHAHDVISCHAVAGRLIMSCCSIGLEINSFKLYCTQHYKRSCKLFF